MSLARRVLKGYRSSLSRLAGFAALLGLCVLVGFIVAWPAWKLSQANPRAFTALFLAFALAVLAFFLFRGIRAAWRANSSLFLIKAASRLLLLAGLALFVWQTLARRVPLAIAFLVAGMLAAGFVRFGLASQERGEKAQGKG